MADPFTSIATGLSSVSGFVIKLCEYTYALRAVDQQTEAYLTTAKHAWENIQTCRRLLQLRQEHLPVAERKDYERVLNEAKTAAEEVARLLEPARVDVESDGQLSFSTRMLWVLRDDPAIVAALRRLNLVHTTLTQNISALRLMQGHDESSLDLTKSYSSGRDKLPSYEASELLHWKRQTRNTLVAQGLKIYWPPERPQVTVETIPQTPNSWSPKRPASPATHSVAEHLPSFRISHSSSTINTYSAGHNGMHPPSSSYMPVNNFRPPLTDPLPLRPYSSLDPSRNSSPTPAARNPPGRSSWLQHQASRMDLRRRHYSTGAIGVQLSQGQSLSGGHAAQARNIAELGVGASRTLSFHSPRFEWELDDSSVGSAPK